jgi:hypothetical protein
VTKNPSTIPFQALPEQCVVKPTHGSGWVHFVTEKTTLDTDALVAQCRQWLAESFFEKTREWPYKDIEPQIIVEEYIDEGTGQVPKDYKLFVFHGTVAMNQVDEGRYVDHRRNLYTPAWEKLDATLHYANIEGPVPLPVHLQEMIRGAELLGAELDFIRADFYDTKNKLYFGELTTTPGGGLESFTPYEIDRELGRLWNMQSIKHAA